MSDIDPQPTNDPSPEPLAEGGEQNPAPETPSAESPGAEATPSDPAPEALPADISAEVDALLGQRGGGSHSPPLATRQPQDSMASPVHPEVRRPQPKCPLAA
ncbi:MAG: hypothetical protein AAGK24_05940, partial [Planctomycetota bacterium]